MSEVINAMYVKIDDIIPNKSQPRKYFNENSLNELAQSIKAHGIINPITVRKLADKYEIIAGERRYRAAKLAGLERVPIIVTTITDQEMSEIALIENLQRQEFTSIEEATSYDKLLSSSNNDSNSLSEKLGKSPNSISNKIKLLSLPEEIKDALATEKISERHAKSLAKLEDKEEQLNLLDKIMREKLTVKETEQLVKQKSISDEEVKNALDAIMNSLKLDQSSADASTDEEAEEEPSSEEQITEEEITSEKTIQEEILQEKSENKDESIIDDQKEEKKEDEKMNNGNFFPNYDNNMAPNPAGMGMMPEQNPMMNQPMPMEQETVMPTPMMNQSMPQEAMAPMMDQTMIPPMMANQNIPTFDYNNAPMDNNNPIPLTPMPQEPMYSPEMTMTPPMMDQPLFNQEAQMPQEPMVPMMEQPIPQEMTNPGVPEPQPIEVPTFNPMQDATPMMEQAPQNMPVPDLMAPMMDQTMTPPMMEQSAGVNKVAQVEEFLNQNGIPYKSYNNETGHCIIIEL